MLASDALDRYLRTPRGQYVQEHGEVSSVHVTHHKRTVHELGSHRYIVAACATDRPAFVVTYCEDGGDPREICHFYVAQGLRKQHKDMKPLLARTNDFEFAYSLLLEVQARLNIDRCTIRPIARDPTCNAVASLELALLQTNGCTFSTAPMSSQPSARPCYACGVRQ